MLKMLKTQKGQNYMVMIIMVLVLALFLNGYLSAKNEEENYLMKKLV